jgi:HSP20 family protein
MERRRRYPFGSIGREFDEMMGEMEDRFNNMLQGLESSRLLPAPGARERMIPALRGEFQVDVKDEEDQIVVAADLPGVDKQDVSIRLVDPRTLQIQSRRSSEKEEKGEDYYRRERFFGSMSRDVLLPDDVTEEGSTATFQNGVLEVRLKKQPAKGAKKIEIE